jgi:hypothetical protein
VKAFLSKLIRVFVKAWKGFVKTLILFIGDHTTPGREITLRMGILALVVVVLLPWIKEPQHGASEVNPPIQSAIDPVKVAPSTQVEGSPQLGIRITFRELIYLSSLFVALFSGAWSFKRWLDRRDSRRGNEASVLHGVEGFTLVKAHLLEIIRTLDSDIVVKTGTEPDNLAGESNAENCIFAHFHHQTLKTEIYCSIAPEHVPANLTSVYPGSKLVLHPLGNVLITISHSHDLDRFIGLFHLAVLNRLSKP